MAIIKCPECGKEVSDTCSVCIHCGYRLKALTDYSYTDNSKIEHAVRYTSWDHFARFISLALLSLFFLGGGIFYIFSKEEQAIKVGICFFAFFGSICTAIGAAYWFYKWRWLNK